MPAKLSVALPDTISTLFIDAQWTGSWRSDSYIEESRDVIMFETADRLCALHQAITAVAIVAIVTLGIGSPHSRSAEMLTTD